MKLPGRKLLISSFLAASVCAVPSALASAGHSSLQLKTSVEDVNGVREIESGNYESGIRKTHAALAKTSVGSRRAPLLNNLCVAHIASGDTASAESVCDQAVDTANNKAIALNNRAILKCTSGEPAGCHQDLKQANALASHNHLISKNFALVADSPLVVKQ
ncbi:hypothetical protein HHX48_10905 [Salinimonas sp. HHU 13199]|uniref:Tetratricopeptide repeat protein n=1 Tax=Salinimonas profundi TaxID=2729140 RepID=A0ABR8LJ60_9ALTE|nr:hypothetical protein [Salinimonas profundi]MBD3586248.1 hypothetical protein [Salinimonas profundi]